MSKNQEDNSVPKLLDDSSIGNAPISPEDTAPLDPGATDPNSAATVADSEKSIMAATKSGTNLDTLIGLVTARISSSRDFKRAVGTLSEDLDFVAGTSRT